MKNEHMNHIELRNSISGSVLFDWHKQAMAKHLCGLFPGLTKREEVDSSGAKWLIVEGELNDYWYAKYSDFVMTRAMEVGNPDTAAAGV